MNTKNISKVNITKKVEKILKTAKNSANKANNHALKATEETVIETIAIAGKWQKVTEKALKGVVKLLDNQQNIIFDTLDTYKSHFEKGKEKFSKLFV